MYEFDMKTCISKIAELKICVKVFMMKIEGV
jgi:hypothetical protein